MRNSASPGYWERKLTDAPTSMRPAEISKTVPRSMVTPLYSHAVFFAVVVDMRPYSTAHVRIARLSCLEGRWMARARQRMKRIDELLPLPA